MITRHGERQARQWACAAVGVAGLVLRDSEIERIEVADCGFGRLGQVGAQILTLEADAWVSMGIPRRQPRDRERSGQEGPLGSSHREAVM